MLKLILADDEEMIRESIRALIDWDSIGVEVVASCKNGPETLQAILTLHPDIVMTVSYTHLTLPTILRV